MCHDLLCPFAVFVPTEGNHGQKRQNASLGEALPSILARFFGQSFSIFNIFCILMPGK